MPVSSNVRPQLFKYAASRYNALLVTMGCLRIGTLYDYRRAEHRRGIADPTEGKKRVAHHVSSLHIADSNDPSVRQSKDLRALEAFRALRIENSKNVRIENVSVSQQFDTPDCFVYCLSSTNSALMYGEFEGIDSCVEVIDPHSFFQHVSVSLNAITRVAFQGIHRVTYTSREQRWNGVDWGTHPALLKESTFQSQAELRAIWTPVFENLLEPTIIGNSRLPSYCKNVNPGRGRRVAVHSS